MPGKTEVELNKIKGMVIFLTIVTGLSLILLFFALFRNSIIIALTP